MNNAKIVVMHGPVLLGPFDQLSFQSWADVKETFRLCNRDLLSLKNGKEVWIVTNADIMSLQLA